MISILISKSIEFLITLWSFWVQMNGKLSRNKSFSAFWHILLCNDTPLLLCWFFPIFTFSSTLQCIAMIIEVKSSFILHIGRYSIKGAELASATMPWHWLFFCLASKLCYKNLPWNNYTQKISSEASKWHWLI